MRKDLFNLLDEQKIPDLLLSKRRLVLNSPIGTALLFASLFKKREGNYAILAPNQYSAQKIYEALLSFLSEDKVAFFPSDELLRAEAVSSSKELMAQRLYAMDLLLQEGGKILVTHPSAALRFLMDPAYFKKQTITIKKGQNYDLVHLCEQLIALGYKKVNKIDQTLQFALRGDVLDIFSVNERKPIRLEFFDEECESIREFDIETQTSLNSRDVFRILPAAEVLFDDETLNDFALKAKKEVDKQAAKLSIADAEELENHFSNDLSNIIERNFNPSSYWYFGYGSKSTYSIFHYQNPSLLFILDEEGTKEAIDHLLLEASEYYGELAASHRIPYGLRHYMNFLEAVPNTSALRFSTRFYQRDSDYVIQMREAISTGTGIAAMGPTIETYLQAGDKVVICGGEGERHELIANYFEENHIAYEETEGFELPDAPAAISHLFLSTGFEVPEAKVVFLTPNELFGRRSVSTRFTARFKNATILRSAEELRPGDYVVHEYRGIGQFLSMENKEMDGVHRDYIKIAYAGGETLYVPLEQFRLLRKYSGREGVAPKLSHLAGNDWKKKKEHIEAKVGELADRLYNLYKERASEPGFAFPKDDELQKAFEDEFPYELTPDQAKALEEIKADMESPKIMDRLLCGDVGFGKTEVAFRAAYKALLAGKQVALLCPTTLLARQHFELAETRFLSKGVRIAQFSRLVPKKEMKEQSEDLKNGKIDLAIGTHSLLSSSISFKDLGLLIIDEEQRFGVEQKEKIKEMKRRVDVLTLSATPIPRTLQMSLLGVRALSEITTAPEGRMPIQTYVIPYNENVVGELLARELARGGQAFYVHNQVISIYQKAAALQKLLPTAQIGVIHGQMPKEETEDIMGQFYEGKIQILVATSIIENGIDIPKANLIIVESADHFGLSQLYQIKGRVGRGDTIAYAYLTYRPGKKMTEEGEKRLKAIQEFTDLGSGYKIAQRDLMIRGAGDILGPEQAGFIDAIGLDLYLSMLSEAVEERKTGKKKEERKANKLLGIDAYIPDDYAINSDKLQMYREIENIKNNEELQEYMKKTRDIYGRFPLPLERLFEKKRLDILLAGEEFGSLEEQSDSVDLYLSNSFSKISGIGVALFDALTPLLPFIRVSFADRKLRVSLRKEDDWFANLIRLVHLIHKVYRNKIDA